MPNFTDENIQRLFGREDAENELPSRLKEFFFRNRAYANLTGNLPIRILVGHKGVGKSALLKLAQLEDIEKRILSLWIQPNDIKAIYSNNTLNLNQMIESWKEGIVNLIFQKIAQEYFGAAADTIHPRLKGIVRPLLGAVKNTVTGMIHRVADNATKEVMERFLVNGQIRVYLDDLDRGWEAKPNDIKNMSALLNAIRDLCGSQTNLQFRLGLRSDVYHLVRTSDESTDKIEGNIIWLTWTNHEILAVIAKRIETYFGRNADENDLVKRRQIEIARYLDPVLEPRFLHAGKWQNIEIHKVLLSLTRMRPRDLVKLLSGAAKEAFRDHRTVISSENLRNTFERYSAERLQDIVNEFKTELPHIGNLVNGMRPAKRERTAAEMFLYTNDEIITKIRNIMQSYNFTFTNGRIVSAKELASFLYKIDFIIARKDRPDGVIERRFFDQAQFLAEQFIESGFKWEVHPAYRWALQPGNIDAVYENIKLGDA